MVIAVYVLQTFFEAAIYMYEQYIFETQNSLI